MRKNAIQGSDYSAVQGLHKGEHAEGDNAAAASDSTPP